MTTNLETSNVLWERARALELEHHAALSAARSYDVQHDLDWPCDMPNRDGSPCTNRGWCKKHDD